MDKCSYVNLNDLSNVLLKMFPFNAIALTIEILNIMETLSNLNIHNNKNARFYFLFYKSITQSLNIIKSYLVHKK